MSSREKSQKITLDKELDELGAIVLFHRKKSGLTQAQLAKLAGIGKTAVFDLEHRIKHPRLDTIARILQVLNIRVAFDSPLMRDYMEQRDAQG